MANWPPAECPAITILVRFGKAALLASWRTISSTKSNDEMLGLVDCTVNPNVLDCWPFGLFTRIVHVPGPLSVICIWNELALTLFGEAA